MSDYTPYLEGDIILCADEETWKAERMKGIGGSDASVVMGASRYNSTYSLWALKSGLITDDEQSEPAYWGTVMEDPIREHFSKKYGIEVQMDKPYTIRLDAEHPFLRATLDGLIPPGQDLSKLPFEVDSSTWGIYEGKTASQYMVEHWAKGPPANYYYQVQHYMMVTGAAYSIVSVLFGGNTYDVYLVERDDDVIEFMRDEELEFWRRVQEKDEPEADGHEKTKDALNAQQDENPEDSIELPREAAEWDARLQELKEIIADSELEVETLKNRLRKALRHAIIGTIPDYDFKYSYKATKKRGGGLTKTLRRIRA